MLEKHVELENAYLKVRSKEEAKLLIDSCSEDDVMFSTHDPNGIYNDVSKTCETLIGYSKKDLIGSSPYDYFNPEDFQAILKSHAKVTIRPEVDRVNYRIRKKDGTFQPVRSLSRQIKDSSGLEFIFVVTFSGH
ncbi:MAG: PAS domain S-box protein [Flavobacteriales bacterium]|nr:PAS domain-containing protein [Flavobacteriales bacterium]MCB9190208.1 PAS domain S-box protein [Flavobacteriales bacterium]